MPPTGTDRLFVPKREQFLIEYEYISDQDAVSHYEGIFATSVENAYETVKDMIFYKNRRIIGVWKKAATVQTVEIRQLRRIT